jgi:hypothetical protein
MWDWKRGGTWRGEYGHNLGIRIRAVVSGVMTDHCQAEYVLLEMPEKTVIEEGEEKIEI